MLGHAALECLTADVIGDADEEASAGAEFRFAAEVDAAGRIAAECLVGHGGVVAVESDDEGDIEISLKWKGGGGIDGEVPVQENGMAACEGADELRSDAGGEEETSMEFIGEGIVAGEDHGFAGVKAEAGGNEAESCKTGREAAQSVGLGGDEGFRWGEKMVWVMAGLGSGFPGVNRTRGENRGAEGVWLRAGIVANSMLARAET